MAQVKPQSYLLFFYPTNKRAVLWANKIRVFLKNKYKDVLETLEKPEVVIVLGGDGTILEAARKYHETGSIILGLNLGNVGFLASVRNESNFFKFLDIFFQGKYKIIERMMLSAQVERGKKIVFTAEALNEVVVKNPLGLVELQVKIEDHPVKYIRGTGILISTATGSTAYNLSAHGPIVMPDIKCFIVTEILDHSIPSPSVVVKYNNTVKIEVIKYRKTGALSLSKNNKKIDVVLMADGESIFPLEERDKIIIKSSSHLIRFAETEKNYFFKSLQEKFGFE